MITFVDTNVLLDIFLPDPKWGEQSTKALEKAYGEGSIIINEIIYAELAPQFPSKPQLDNTLKTLGMRIVPLDNDTAYHSGMAWKKYKKAGGKSSRVLADFFIGAHSLALADRLLTRDRGFYKTYFKSLKIFY